MPKRELTEEDRERLKANLAKGRATAAANRAKKAAEPAEIKAKAAAPASENELVEEPAPPETPAPIEEALAVIEEPVAADPLKLDAEEMESIRAQAREKVDAELAEARKADRKKLIAAALDDEILAQRAEAGLINYQDEMVTFQIHPAPFSPGIIIDGALYAAGTWVTKPRRVYDSIRDAVARSWESEDRAGNPKRNGYGYDAAVERQMAGIINPLMLEHRNADGSFTTGNGPIGALRG